MFIKIKVMKKATGNYGLKIKTNQYAGNFERELTAFCTGQHGDEDDTGREFVEVLPISFDNIENVPDDNGCWRPVSLDDDNADNLIIYFDSEPTQEQIDFIKNRALLFSEVRANHPTWGQFYKDSPKIEILGVEVVKY